MVIRSDLLGGPAVENDPGELRGAWFPGPIPRPSRALLTATGYVAGCLAAVLVLLALPAGRSVWDSLWAEDGKVFLSQSLTAHWYSPVFRPSEGYMHLVPRLFGFGARVFPVSDAAVLFGVGSAVLRALLALFVFRASAGHVRSAPLRAFLAVFLILVPSGETLDNVANLHWYLLYAAIWAALWRPASRWENAMAAIVVAAAVCSDPLTLIIAPIVLARCITLRRRRDHLVTAGFLVATVVQLTVVAGASRVQVRPVGWVEILRAYDARILVALLTGHSAAGHLVTGSLRIAVLLLAVVLLAMVLLPGLRADRPTAALVLYLIAASLVLFALGWRHSLGTVARPSRDLNGNSRYDVVPMLLVVTAIVVGMKSVLSRSAIGHRVRLRLAGTGVAVAVVLAAAALSISSVSGANAGPTWRARLDLARHACRTTTMALVAVPVDPGPPWAARIPCARLTAR
ncbi:MAG TPA: hypothetical protein VHX59_06695 [Mycobacteriales bacterium]|jgi:multisubunit Na+/H+ antiporter MnhC subunit|nr:hypothetical protein [Mycobacteriales bacterium]